MKNYAEAMIEQSHIAVVRGVKHLEKTKGKNWRKLVNLDVCNAQVHPHKFTDRLEDAHPLTKLGRLQEQLGLELDRQQEHELGFGLATDHAFEWECLWYEWECLIKNVPWMPGKYFKDVLLEVDKYISNTELATRGKIIVTLPSK